MQSASNQANYAGVEYIEAPEFVSETDLESWKDLLTAGYVLIFRSMVPREDLRRISQSVLSSQIPVTEDTRVVQGVGNIHYTSRNDGGKNAYSTNDSSYYFFPWNDDRTGLVELVQPSFSIVARLNDYDPEKLLKREPKDGTVQRFHMICYPEGSGHISAHLDPVKVVRFTSGLYVTQYGLDYTEGGYYILDQKTEKIHIDPLVKSGDLVIFPAHFVHGVDTVVCRGAASHGDLDFRGRIFLNMTIIESHEVADRAFTQAFKP